MEENKLNEQANSRLYDQLVQDIMNGVLKEGDKIPSENELKDSFNVSRNSVRLALNKLKTMGLIETRRGAGSYVKKAGANISLQAKIPNILFKQHDLRDILEFRKGIEVEAVKLAAKRADESDLYLLRNALNVMKRSVDSMSKFSAADEQMHLLFAKSSKNQMFATMMEMIQEIITNDMKELLVKQGTDIDSIFYHEAILNCIESRKPDEAAFMMERHLSTVVERMDHIV